MTIAPRESAPSAVRSRRLAAGLAAVLVAAVPLLSGCFSGPAASTNTQSLVPSGEGVSTTVGDLSLQSFVLVHQEEGDNAVLIGTIFNEGTEPDVLTRVTIDGHDALVPDLANTVEPQGYLAFGQGGPGANSVAAPALWAEGFVATPGTYSMVAMTFERAGIVEFDALVVPATGYYADVVAPLG